MKKIGLVCLTLLMMCGISFSQESEYEEGLEYLLFMEVPEVVTATLTKKDSFQAPSTMTVLTELDIKRSGAKNIYDLLKTVPGINVQKNTYNRNIIVIRGVREWLSNNKIKFLINGHAVMDQLYGSFSDFIKINLNSIKQIEIIRGPGSCLYGTNAFAGVINIITKKAKEDQKVEVDVNYGSFDTINTNIGFGTVSGDLKVSGNLSYLKTDGDDDLKVTSDKLSILPFLPLSYAPNDMPNSDNNTKIDLNVDYKNFNITAAYVDADWDNYTNQLAYSTQEGEQRAYKYTYIEAQYNIPVSDKIQIKTKLSYDLIKMETNLQAFPNGFTLGADINRDGVFEYWGTGMFADFSSNITEYRAEVVMDFNITDTNQLLLGLFYEDIAFRDHYFYGNANPLYLFKTPFTDWSNTFPAFPDADRTIWGAFIQDEINFTENIYLVLGARFDDYDDFGSSLNPRCGLVWNINQKGGIIKLMYGSAFKAPNFSQLYNQNNPSFDGRENLDAEELDSIEFSLNYIFAEKFQTNFTIFNIDTKNQIDISTERDFTLPMAPRFYINQGKANIKGLEVDLKFVFAENNYIFANYVYTDGEDELLKIDLPIVPETQANLGFNLHFGNYVNWSLVLDYTDELPRESGDPRSSFDAITTVDTSLRIENLNGWDIYFSIYNLLDEDFDYPVRFTDYPHSDVPASGIHYAIGASFKK